MKNTSYILYIIAVTFFLFSCNGNIEEKIIGEWKVETVEFQNMDEVVNTYKKVFEEASEEEIVELKENYTNGFNDIIFTFKENKQFLFDEDEGEWLIKDGKIIAIIENDEIEFEIIKISNDNFEFILPYKFIYSYNIKEEIVAKIKMKCSKNNQN